MDTFDVSKSSVAGLILTNSCVPCGSVVLVIVSLGTIASLLQRQEFNSVAKKNDLPNYPIFQGSPHQGVLVIREEPLDY